MISQEKLAEGIYDLWIETGLAKEAGAGQFIGVYPKNAATLLPRPISICEVNEERMALRLVYRVAGKGTTEFSSLKKDDRIEILGILGNGYRVPELLTGHPEFTEITQLPSYTVTFQHSDGSEDSVSLTATDHYLTGEANAPKGVTVLGGKTGTTSSAGNCLALLCQNSYGEPYVSIVMGASTKELLYQQMTSLLENINTV